ncbi:serine/threonine protein kinase [Candidatus Thiosymbion oneisti]|uniref:serine/threonine protein kinase n=1 Tax=Candidatus Thiosymbion oneisti TaxID=589554 RepID=UPI000B801F95|nr:serine/threonine protein kinase [Candidatus Thiosymbion oneisti]
MDSGYYYTVYGLTLRSNWPLPGLPPTGADVSPDTQVELMLEGEIQPPSADVRQLSSGMRVLSKADGTYFHMWFCGDGRLDFTIDSEGTQVSATWTLSVIEEVMALLLGPVLGFVLRLRGVLCLHACAVAIGGFAIAVLGSSGAGKSTLAAALARRGYAVLSDDRVALNHCDREWQVLPGYPRLRLWPEAIQALYGSEKGLAQVFSFSKKRFVDLTDSSDGTAWRFHRQPLALGALYVLGERKIGLSAPAIEHMRPAMATVALMTHRTIATDHLQLASDKQAREFAGLSRVAMEVPTRRVICSDRLDALPQLCDAIIEDLSVLTD